jgi:putative inorganic carbon (HCO3(-)) transporter
MNCAAQIQPYRASVRAGADAAPAVVATVGWTREWKLFAVIVVAWSFTPLIRRLLDFRAGAFNPVSIASLIPFLLLMPLALYCLKKERMRRMHPAMRTLFYVWCATFAYGFIVSAFSGNFGAATFEMLQYLVPALAGIWIAGLDLDIGIVMKRLALIILPCAGLVAVYGVAQWVQPLPWDVLWVEGSHFTGADAPVPFGMRVFSTLNSPGTAADFLALTLVFAMPSLRLRTAWSLPLLAAVSGALLLTLVREAWIAALLGAVVYLALSPRRFVTVPALAIFVVVVIGLISMLPAMMGSGANSDVLTSRINTFGDVGHDASALARQNEISDAFTQGLNNPIGAGLGNIGAAARLASSAESDLGNVLDSGYLSRFVELGWLGCAGYLVVVIGGPLALLYGLLRRSADPAMTKDAKVAVATGIAMAFALAWGDAANDAHLGLEGFLFWVGMGVGALGLTSGKTLAQLNSDAAAFRRFGRRSA